MEISILKHRKSLTIRLVSVDRTPTHLGLPAQAVSRQCNGTAGTVLAAQTSYGLNFPNPKESLSYTA